MPTSIMCAASLTAESLARSRWLRNIGIAIAARMPMMMITISNSISVNPSLRLVFFIALSPAGLGPSDTRSPRPLSQPQASGEVSFAAAQPAR